MGFDPSLVIVNTPLKLLELSFLEWMRRSVLNVAFCITSCSDVPYLDCVQYALVPER